MRDKAPNLLPKNQLIKTANIHKFIFKMKDKSSYPKWKIEVHNRNERQKFIIEINEGNFYLDSKTQVFI